MKDTYYYRGHYKEYLETKWWRHLWVRYIGRNPNAKCWICGERNKSVLLLHHVTYENLLNEVLGEDVYIICYGRNRCHTRIHFKLATGEKIFIEKQILLKRMRWLKRTHPIRNFRLGSSINSIARFLFAGL